MTTAKSKTRTAQVRNTPLPRGYEERTGGPGRDRDRLPGTGEGQRAAPRA
jgi:hypothetical protein